MLSTLGVNSTALGFAGGFTGTELEGLDAIVKAAQTVRKAGIQQVLVSLGAYRILLIGGQEPYLASPPAVAVKNTVGAGDSAIAGFVYGLTKGEGLKEALVYAAAAGTATTLMPGTALRRKEDFLRLTREVTVREI